MDIAISKNRTILNNFSNYAFGACLAVLALFVDIKGVFTTENGVLPFFLFTLGFLALLHGWWRNYELYTTTKIRNTGLLMVGIGRVFVLFLMVFAARAAASSTDVPSISIVAFLLLLALSAGVGLIPQAVIMHPTYAKERVMLRRELATDALLATSLVLAALGHLLLPALFSGLWLMAGLIVLLAISRPLAMATNRWREPASPYQRGSRSRAESDRTRPQRERQQQGRPQSSGSFSGRRQDSRSGRPTPTETRSGRPDDSRPDKRPEPQPTRRPMPTAAEHEASPEGAGQRRRRRRGNNRRRGGQTSDGQNAAASTPQRGSGQDRQQSEPTRAQEPQRASDSRAPKEQPGRSERKIDVGKPAAPSTVTGKADSKPPVDAPTPKKAADQQTAPAEVKATAIQKAADEKAATSREAPKDSQADVAEAAPAKRGRRRTASKKADTAAPDKKPASVPDAEESPAKPASSRARSTKKRGSRAKQESRQADSEPKKEAESKPKTSDDKTQQQIHYGRGKRSKTQPAGSLDEVDSDLTAVGPADGIDDSDVQYAYKKADRTQITYGRKKVRAPSAMKEAEEAEKETEKKS